MENYLNIQIVYFFLILMIIITTIVDKLDSNDLEKMIVINIFINRIFVKNISRI